MAEEPKGPLVLLGSARKNSDNLQLIENLFDPQEIHLLDLLDHQVYPYNYTGTYPPDDAFPALTTELLQHQALVFATPVYWYAMSGLLKTFFDRLTDLVTIQKKTGRKLQGKKTFLLANGAEAVLPDGFEVPFRSTSAYFGMSFIGTLYHRTGKKEQLPPDASHFRELLQLPPRSIKNRNI
ncbi:flavodoxin family protein [soil metagenome]